MTPLWQVIISILSAIEWEIVPCTIFLFLLCERQFCYYCVSQYFRGPFLAHMSTKCQSELLGSVNVHHCLNDNSTTGPILTKLITIIETLKIFSSEKVGQNSK